MLTIDYSISHPFYPWSYGIRHLEAAIQETSWLGRVVHVLTGLAEISLPLINYIIALFDWAILSANHVPPGGGVFSLLPLSFPQPSQNSYSAILNPQLLDPSLITLINHPVNPLDGKTKFLKERLNLPTSIAEAHYYVEQKILPEIGLEAITTVLKNFLLHNPQPTYDPNKSFDSSRFTDMCCMVGRLRVISLTYEKTHYIFRHAHTAPFHIYHRLMRELIKKHAPDEHHPSGLHFRLPGSVDQLDNAQTFLDNNPDFKSSSSGGALDSKFSNELLSVDTNPWNTTPWESSLYFLASASNISNNYTDLFKQMLINYVPKFISDRLVLKIDSIVSEAAKSTSLGVLYAFCIPKELIDDPKTSFAYRSHTYGFVCKSTGANKDKEMLQHPLNSSNRCPHHFSLQYRLLASHLMRKEVHTYWVDSLPSKNKELLSLQLKMLAEEMYFYARLHELKEMPGDADISYFLKAKALLKDHLDPSCIQYILNQKKIPEFSTWFLSINDNLRKLSA
jgi:hypothetical protein